MTTNVHEVQSTRREWPAWYQRAKVRKVDAKGNVLEDAYAANGEVVAVSPRYQKAGVNFRVRPERPAAFFAAWCHENGLLPELLTPEECEQEWALALLDPLWAKNRYRFPVLGSPFAACDAQTVPSHRVGFSFNILQVLVEHLDSLRSAAGKATTFRPGMNGHSNGADLEAARRVIEAMRARAKSAPAPDQPAAPPPPSEDDEGLSELRELLAANAAKKAAAQPNGDSAPAEPPPEPPAPSAPEPEATAAQSRRGRRQPA